MNESLVVEDSELIVIGFDKGEGLAIRFAASEEEPRGGIFTSFGTSFLSEVCSAMVLAIGEENGAGFAVANFEPIGSRLDA